MKSIGILICFATLTGCAIQDAGVSDEGSPMRSYTPHQNMAATPNQQNNAATSAAKMISPAT